ncbi:AcrR family transcriptional regulator [Peptoniphilus olsenii]|uniref:AcrR family transcriptional regulator n=1 Tax=Peptoniphilus olsenii TaxID=411570 RepID=A0ABV2JDC5_9FIRM
MLTVDERKKEKENKITEAAISSFREKGIDKTSIRDIMKKSGFGLGTFYLYFKDKKDLEEKIVLDILTDLFYKAEEQCSDEENPTKRYICFISYIIDYLIKDPLELELISKNANWALYAKVENDDRFKEADTTLKFILNKYASLFSVKLSESEQLFILSLTIHIVLSTCKSSLMEDSVLSIEEMKPVLFKIVEKIFR